MKVSTKGFKIMDKKELDNRLDKISDKLENAFIDKDINPDLFQELYDELQLLKQENPDSIDVLTYFSLLFQANRDYKTAIEYYEQALAIAHDEKTIENIKSSIKDCKYLMELIQECLGQDNNPYTKNKSDSLLDKVPPLLLFIIKIVIFITIIFMYCPSLIFSGNDKKILDKTDYYKVENATKNEQVNTQSDDTTNYQALVVNPASSYNYLSKNEIYNLRKKYVAKSLFANKNYEPNNNIFGGIVDGKPWWGSNPCSQLDYKGDYHERIEGPSKVSAQVNNPNALVGVSMAYSPWEYEYNKDFCSSKAPLFLPDALFYNKAENMIVAKYKVPSKFPSFKSNVNGREYGYPLQLSGLNAIDFGYKYVYAMQMQNSTIMYPDQSNITNNVQIFNDYIHLGGSCKFEGGCNNISPMQSDKMFTINYLPATLTLKLWKEKPSNKFSKADIYYKIIIDD